MTINWSEVVVYALGVAGAYMMGKPAVQKAYQKLMSLKSKYMPVVSETNPVPTYEGGGFAADDAEMVGEVMVADSLLHAAFSFKDRGNQKAVDHCMDAMKEITKVERANTIKLETPSAG